LFQSLTLDGGQASQLTATSEGIKNKTYADQRVTCEVCVEEAGAFEVGLLQQRTQIQEKYTAEHSKLLCSILKVQSKIC
jgi:hypothetical protein